MATRKSSKSQTFEKQMEDLQTIVNNLEQGNVPLEESINQFKDGMKLVNSLQKQLSGAEKTLAKVIDEQGQEKEFAQDDQTSFGKFNGSKDTTDANMSDLF
jgi:exodeoxyribonuclease VII small subunit